MATKYELPEEINEKRLLTLGMEVEMKTFKTNVVREEEPEEPSDNSRKTLKTNVVPGLNPGKSGRAALSKTTKITSFVPEGETGQSCRLPLLKILCVGDSSSDGEEKISAFIEHYLKVKSSLTPTTRASSYGRYFKIIKCQRNDTGDSFSIKLHLQILKKAENLNKDAIYSQFKIAALVFWETRNPSSLDGAIKWRENMKEFLPSIPCVLVTLTDNAAGPTQRLLQWFRPGKIFKSEEALLDQFCKDHGFVDHFEIKSRDWVSGEKSVFGQAVNCLLGEFF